MKIKIAFISRNKKIELNCFWWQTFNNIYAKIDKQLEIPQEDSRDCTRFFSISLNDKDVTPLDDFRVNKFIKINSLNPYEIVCTNYEYAGIGGGDFVNDKLKIEIRANEGHHKGKPHIHVSNCKGKRAVSFDLNNLSILKGREYWKKDFSKPEKRNVIDMLEGSKNEFIRYYKELQHGYIPEPVKYLYDGEEYVFL